MTNARSTETPVNTGDVTLNAAQIMEARGWLVDAFGPSWRGVDSASVPACIDKAYDGGLAQFAADTSQLA